MDHLEHFAAAIRTVEASLGLKPPAPAVYIGTQQWPHRVVASIYVTDAYKTALHEWDCPGCMNEPLDLFELTQPVPGHPEGSTVSDQTLTELGYALPNRRIA